MLSLLQNEWDVQLCILFLSREKKPWNRTISYAMHLSDLGNHGLFLDTYNARLSTISIDYAWSGCIVKSKPSNLPKEWMTYSENHQHFTAYRKIMLLRHTQPIDAFALGVKNLPRNSCVPENLFMRIKKDWCNCPEGFESALNWKAYH